MHPTDEELRKAVALFRYGLIADVLRLPPGSRDIRRALNEKAQRTYVIPGTRRSRVSARTLFDGAVSAHARARQAFSASAAG